MPGFLNNQPLSKIDPDVERLIALEAERQEQKLILVPSESAAPLAIRESLGSILQNIYAEGYPDEASRYFSQPEIMDVNKRLAHYRRYSDPRYYKGVEFADMLEALARRRCAELFACNGVSADDFFVNVQPLSGAPANNAVYHALINPGDSILGLNLFHGGHLTHGSSVNRSGKLYKAFHYSVDPLTEIIDYDQVELIAVEQKPRVIIAGFSSYPWAPDWERFRKIADAAGAYLLADISHIAGMVAAREIPSPVGFAHVITFTTHKTMCGPRGACILSFDEAISRKIDKAVFPGEQGGPHVQVMAAMATTFKLASQKSFQDFQQQIINNCAALNDQLSKRGFRMAYGGTNTHLTNLDCKTIIGSDGTMLSGDMAARILDLAGLVANANAIPGDKSALRSSGVRLGTPWLTQRGLVEEDMLEIANIIADILFAVKPYSYSSGSTRLSRAKVDFQTFEKCKLRVRELIRKAFPAPIVNAAGDSQFHFLDDKFTDNPSGFISFEITGEHLCQSLNYILVDNIESIKVANSGQSALSIEGERVPVILTAAEKDKYILSVPVERAALVNAWLKDISDGFIDLGDDLIRRIPGPFVVKQISSPPEIPAEQIAGEALKPYYISIPAVNNSNKVDLPDFTWEHGAETAIKFTPLHQRHMELGAKMVPFAGWDMPVWYSSVLEEHLSTRNTAGLFDVSHMGVYQAQGEHAVAFLDCVCANDISALEVGESCYTHFLDSHANVIDDLLVYRHADQQYLIVVNAANDDKDWAWLNAVKDGSVKVDEERPWTHAFGLEVILRNLRDPQSGEDMRVDIALQGPLSRDILGQIGLSKANQKRLLKLKRTRLAHFSWKDLDLIISRTGYTGEKIAFEIFIHPERALELWNTIIEIGTPLGLKPCGLGARDSLRTEAGLPLYGHEMGGDMNLGVAQAGFGAYVKTYKPWFIGRQSYLDKENHRQKEVARFRFEEKRVRMAHSGDLVLNDKGKVIGQVTSCAIDKEEFLTGQAYIDINHIADGNVIYIYQNTSAIAPVAFSELKNGSKLQMPDRAVIINRFLK